VHPLRHPRNAIFVGLLFSFIGVVYWFVQYRADFHADIAGVTLLLLLGVAVSIMAYVLIAGSPND
jgi:ABC-type multidrug transport system permease subunit